MTEKQQYRSLFWPLVLIGAGVIALLGTMGVLSRANIVVLFRLWPVLLILVGLDIMFGRRSPAIGALIGVGAIASIIGLMLIGPSMGWGDEAEIKTSVFSEPIGEATSARVNLELSSGSTQIAALSDSGKLIDAELNYTGDIDFEVRGNQEKTVNLSESDADPYFWFDWFSSDDDELLWDIGLSPQLPLSLDIDAGSGSLEFDLRELQLSELGLDVGSGSVNGRLPPTEKRYDVRVNGGSGSCTLDLADGADADLEIDVGSGSVKITLGDRTDIELRIDGGSGKLTVDVPEDAAARLEVRAGGSGSVRVPSRFDRTRGGDDDEGIWETAGFDNADHRIEIIVQDLGSGDVELR